MRAPRIAYLCSDRGIPVDGSKGASVHFREFARAVLRSGIEIEAVMSRPPASPFGEFPLRVATPAQSGHDPLARELTELTDQRALADALEAVGPIDAIYERYSLFGLSGLRHARATGVPLFLEVNAPLWEEATRFRGLRAPSLARSVGQAVMSNAHRVLVVSEGLRDRVIEEGADPERVVVFPNGVSPLFLNSARPAERPRSLRNRPVLTFVGSLKPWHGIEMLIEGFKTIPESVGLGLWVVGDGPEADRVDALALEHPDRVVRTPAVAHEDVPSILRASDMTVAPYTSASPSYFCPLKVIEAFAAGIPLLASDVTAVRNLDLAGLAFHRFEPDSPPSFRSALLTVVADLEGARERAGANRAIAASRFTWDDRARELSEMLAGPWPQVGAA